MFKLGRLGGYGMCKVTRDSEPDTDILYVKRIVDLASAVPLEIEQIREKYKMNPPYKSLKNDSPEIQTRWLKMFNCNEMNPIRHKREDTVYVFKNVITGMYYWMEICNVLDRDVGQRKNDHIWLYPNYDSPYIIPTKHNSYFTYMDTINKQLGFKTNVLDEEAAGYDFNVNTKDGKVKLEDTNGNLMGLDSVNNIMVLHLNKGLEIFTGLEMFDKNVNDVNNSVFKRNLGLDKTKDVPTAYIKIDDNYKSKSVNFDILASTSPTDEIESEFEYKFDPKEAKLYEPPAKDDLKAPPAKTFPSRIHGEPGMIMLNGELIRFLGKKADLLTLIFFKITSKDVFINAGNKITDTAVTIEMNAKSLFNIKTPRYLSEIKPYIKPEDIDKEESKKKLKVYSKVESTPGKWYSKSANDNEGLTASSIVNVGEVISIVNKDNEHKHAKIATKLEEIETSVYTYYKGGPVPYPSICKRTTNIKSIKTKIYEKALKNELKHTENLTLGGHTRKIVNINSESSSSSSMTTTKKTFSATSGSGTAKLTSNVTTNLERHTINISRDGGSNITETIFDTGYFSTKLYSKTDNSYSEKKMGSSASYTVLYDAPKKITAKTNLTTDKVDMYVSDVSGKTQKGNIIINKGYATTKIIDESTSTGYITLTDAMVTTSIKDVEDGELKIIKNKNSIKTTLTEKDSNYINNIDTKSIKTTLTEKDSNYINNIDTKSIKTNLKSKDITYSNSVDDGGVTISFKKGNETTSLKLNDVMSEVSTSNGLTLKGTKGMNISGNGVSISGVISELAGIVSGLTMEGTVSISVPKTTTTTSTDDDGKETTTSKTTNETVSASVSVSVSDDDKTALSGILDKINKFAGTA